jgi:predicted flap endonuclease-1-like 5' DNA nuclease
MTTELIYFQEHHITARQAVAKRLRVLADMVESKTFFMGDHAVALPDEVELEMELDDEGDEGMELELELHWKPWEKMAAKALTITASENMDDQELEGSNRAVTNVANGYSAADDNLEVIEGIGPKIKQALIGAGIDSFAKLHSASEEQLKAALIKAEIRIPASLGSWNSQAEYLVKGDMEGFKAYTDRLIAGREPETA